MLPLSGDGTHQLHRVVARKLQQINRLSCHSTVIAIQIQSEVATRVLNEISPNLDSHASLDGLRSSLEHSRDFFIKIFAKERDLEGQC